MFFHLSLRLKRGPWRRNFYSSCLALRQGDVNAFGAPCSAAASIESYGEYLFGIQSKVATE
jgi:hypothetical protein